MRLLECQHCGQLLCFSNTRCERRAHSALYILERLETAGIKLRFIHGQARETGVPGTGVVVSGADLRQPVSVAIFASLVLGKPISVMAFSWIAVRLGLASLAQSLSWPFLGAGALLTGIGFTMSLFIAGLAYAPTMLDAAKVGILSASVTSAAAGLFTLAWLTTGRRSA